MNDFLDHPAENTAAIRGAAERVRLALDLAALQIRIDVPGDAEALCAGLREIEVRAVAAIRGVP